MYTSHDVYNADFIEINHQIKSGYTSNIGLQCNKHHLMWLLVFLVAPVNL